MSATRRRTAVSLNAINVGYLDLERQLEHRLVDRLLYHLGHRRGLLSFWYHDWDASRHIIHLVG